MIGKIVTESVDRQPLWSDRGVERDLGAIAWSKIASWITAWTGSFGLSGDRPDCLLDCRLTRWRHGSRSEGVVCNLRHCGRIYRSSATGAQFQWDRTDPNAICQVLQYYNAIALIWPWLVRLWQKNGGSSKGISLRFATVWGNYTDWFSDCDGAVQSVPIWSNWDWIESLTQLYRDWWDRGLQPAKVSIPICAALAPTGEHNLAQSGSDGIPVPDPSRTFFQVPDPSRPEKWKWLGTG